MHFYRPINIILEGNTGAGKSTLCRLFYDALDAHIIKEPFDLWQNFNGKNVFDTYNKNQSEWAYQFQTFAFFTFMERYIKNAQRIGLNIYDRSMYSAFLGYARMYLENNAISEIEYEMFEHIFKTMCNMDMFKPDGFIYLRAPAEVCYERTKKRNRSEETEMTLHFFQTLEKYHDDWLHQDNPTIPEIQDIPVVVVDAMLPFDNDAHAQKEVVQKVEDFLLDIIMNEQPSEKTYLEHIASN